MAASRDPDSLFLDHLKFVQMGGAHLTESDGGGIVQDGAHDGHQSFGRKTTVQPG